MDQTAYIAAALLFMFFVYVTAKGELPRYISLIL